MFFSNENIEGLRAGRDSISGKYSNLAASYLGHEFASARAREFATHGFLRRLKLLNRCIGNVFEMLPPDRIELPETDQLTDAAINIQAFVFNTFGCLDNLAWAWVSEKDLKKPDGSPIPNKWIGLGKANASIRDSLSTDFRTRLEEFDEWFDILENYRHALAHRIPLYIPPSILTDDKKADYRDLDDQMAKAYSNQDFDEYGRLSAKQGTLAVFHPFMTHSFEENAPKVVFHAQLLADFATVEEIGQRMLKELRRNADPSGVAA